MTRSGRDPFRHPFLVPPHRGGNDGNGSGGSRNDGNDGNGSQPLSMDSDWPERLRRAVEQTLAERQRRAEIRRQLAEARTAGLAHRHAAKLARLEGTMPTTTLAAAEPRIVRCRYLKKTGDPCSAEAVDPLGEVILCTRHLAAALELIRRRAGA